MSTDVMDRPTTTGEDHYEAAGEQLQQSLAEQTDHAAGEPADSPTELRRQHYEEMVTSGRLVRDAKRNMETLKAEYASAKKEYEGLQAAHMRLTGRDPMQRPLPLDEPDESDGPAPVDDSWRRLDINVLAITPAVIDKLYQAGVMTLGDVSDYWKSGKQLVDLKGIGEASDTAVRDAFSNYGVEHPEVFGDRATVAGAVEGGEGGEIDPDEPEADDDETDGD